MAGNDNDSWIRAEGDAMKDYLIGAKIGFGSTGYVHLIKKMESDAEVCAIKLDETSSYLNERSAYKILGAVSPQATYPLHVPRVYGFGICGQKNAIIMELMGSSLSNLFTLNANRFSLKTIVQIANQMIDCIEYVHTRGLIHRDIKPSNFVVGKHDKSKIFLIDYGLTMQYKTPITNDHVPFCNYRRRGTPAFMSLNVHNDCRPSRRDDMESMMYTLIYFLSPSLFKQGSAHRKNKELSEKVICEGLPPEIENCLTNIRALGYTDTPDYHFYRNQFQRIFRENNYVEDSLYDWSD